MLGQLVTVIHVFISCFLILIVLLQQGKGADAGATFGGGGQTFFGASGADNLLTKVTTITAIAFMCTSILLATSIKTSVTDQGELLKMLDATPAQPAAAPLSEEAPANETGDAPAANVDDTPDEAAGKAVAEGDEVSANQEATTVDSVETTQDASSQTEAAPAEAQTASEAEKDAPEETQQQAPTQ